MLTLNPSLILLDSPPSLEAHLSIDNNKIRRLSGGPLVMVKAPRNGMASRKQPDLATLKMSSTIKSNYKEISSQL